MATHNLGRVAYADKGAYNSSTTYINKDVVQYNNGSYVLQADTATGIVPTNTSYWTPMQNPTALNQATASANAAANNANTAADNANQAANGIQGEISNIKYDMWDLAPALACQSSGCRISLDDSCERPLQRLRLYGKTTQDGTPTPDNPVELVSIGDGGSICSTIVGKNLLPYPYNIGTEYTTNGVTATVNSDGSIALSGTATGAAYFYLTPYTSDYDNGLRTPTGTVYCRGCPAGGSVTTYRLVFSVYKDGKYQRGYMDIGSEGQITINPGDYIQCYIRVESGVSADGLVFSPMCSSEQGTDFTQSAKQMLKVLTPNGMPGITVSSGGNYADDDGQQWVCDEVDFESRKYIQRIGQIKIDGSQTPIEIKPRTNSIRVIYSGYPNANLTEKQMCNRFEQGPVYSTDIIGSLMSKDNTRSFILGLPLDAGTTIDSVEAWLAANPVHHIYILEKENQIDLTAEELEQYAAIRTNYQNTTITNDADAWMEIDYRADTKLYIDKKFDELKNDVLSLGGNI